MHDIFIPSPPFFFYLLLEIQRKTSVHGRMDGRAEEPSKVFSSHQLQQKK
jgi:hypothetical protein